MNNDCLIPYGEDSIFHKFINDEWIRVFPYDKHQKKLTELEIKQSFFDEDIIKNQIALLEEELKPIKDLIASYKYDPRFEMYAKLIVMAYEATDKINHLSRLKRLLIKKVTNKSLLTDIDIQSAKEYPIENIYSFTNIKRYGNKQRASCPLHEDSTPSFYIYSGNTFYCFSCNSGGSAIDFYMKLNNVDFKSAVLALK